MKKRLIALLLIAAAVFPAACAKEDPDALTILGKKSDLEKSYMQDIFSLYREKTGKSLKIVEYEDEKYEAEAIKLFEKGEVPDLFMHFHNADLARFDVAGNFRYLNDRAWVSDLTDGARNYCTDSDGNLLGLPFWESSISGCYYNKTILDGLGLKAATNQAEFDGLCGALAVAGYTPICWPADGCSWMFQFGLDPVFADNPDLLEKLNAGETSFAEIPAVTDMFTWIADAKKWFGDDCFRTGWDEISPALNSGEAVMTFIWDTWFYTDFTAGKYKADDFALMPVFMNTADEGTYEGGNLNMMMVNKNGEKLDEALAFLDFCASPENYNRAFEGISTVSCFKGMTTNIQSPMVTDAAASIAAKERVSTAATKIVGYSADNVAGIVNRLLRGEITVAESIRLMDTDRNAK